MAIKSPSFCLKRSSFFIHFYRMISLIIEFYSFVSFNTSNISLCFFIPCTFYSDMSTVNVMLVHLQIGCLFSSFNIVFLWMSYPLGGCMCGCTYIFPGWCWLNLPWCSLVSFINTKKFSTITDLDSSFFRFFLVVFQLSVCFYCLSLTSLILS